MTGNGGPRARCREFFADPMRNYQKIEIALRIIFDMADSARGVSLRDIRFNYSDKPLSRRTAERYRNTVKRVLPSFEEVNPHQYPKRWRLANKPLNGLAKILSGDLIRLADAPATPRSVKKRQADGSVTRLVERV
jgi:hypothetical protein